MDAFMPSLEDDGFEIDLESTYSPRKSKKIRSKQIIKNQDSEGSFNQKSLPFPTGGNSTPTVKKMHQSQPTSSKNLNENYQQILNKIPRCRPQSQPQPKSLQFSEVNSRQTLNTIRQSESQPKSFQIQNRNTQPTLNTIRKSEPQPKPLLPPTGNSQSTLNTSHLSQSQPKSFPIPTGNSQSTLNTIRQSESQPKSFPIPTGNSQSTLNTIRQFEPQSKSFLPTMGKSQSTLNTSHQSQSQPNSFPIPTGNSQSTLNTIRKSESQPKPFPIATEYCQSTLNTIRKSEPQPKSLLLTMGKSQSTLNTSHLSQSQPKSFRISIGNSQSTLNTIRQSEPQPKSLLPPKGKSQSTLNASHLSQSQPKSFLTKEDSQPVFNKTCLSQPTSSEIRMVNPVLTLNENHMSQPKLNEEPHLNLKYGRSYSQPKPSGLLESPRKVTEIFKSQQKLIRKSPLSLSDQLQKKPKLEASKGLPSPKQPLNLSAMGHPLQHTSLIKPLPHQSIQVPQKLHPQFIELLPSKTLDTTIPNQTSGQTQLKLQHNLKLSKSTSQNSRKSSHSPEKRLESPAQQKNVVHFTTPEQQQVMPSLQTLNKQLVQIDETPQQSSQKIERIPFVESLQDLPCSSGLSQRSSHPHQNNQISSSSNQQATPHGSASRGTGTPHRNPPLNIQKAQLQPGRYSMYSKSQRRLELEVAEQIRTDPKIQARWGFMDEQQRNNLIVLVAHKRRAQQIREQQIAQLKQRIRVVQRPQQRQTTTILSLEGVSLQQKTITTSIPQRASVSQEKPQQSSNSQQRAVVVQIQPKDSDSEQEILFATQDNEEHNVAVEDESLIVLADESQSVFSTPDDANDDSPGKEQERWIVKCSDVEDSEPEPVYYGYDPSVKLPPNKFLTGSIFWAVEKLKFPEWPKVVLKYGGEVATEYGPRLTHVLCETQNFPEFQKCIQEGKRLVTLHWLSDICLKKLMTPPFHSIHLPVPFSEADPPLKEKIYCVSGFVGEDHWRARLICKTAGATIAPVLTTFVDAVVVKRANTAYYRKAIDYKIPVVNIQFLNEVLVGDKSCLKKIRSPKYQNFDIDDPFHLNVALVPQLMAAWEVPLKVNVAELRENKPLNRRDTTVSEVPSKKLKQDSNIISCIA